MVNSGRMLWDALGVGSGGGSLEKLKIRSEARAGRQGKVLQWKPSFDVLFNPGELHFTRKVEWDAKEQATKGFKGASRNLEFVKSVPERLQLTLFFDTYEPRSRGADLRNLLVPTNPFGADAPGAYDVRTHTDRVANLAKVRKELHRPPRCELSWGGAQLFFGVLTRLDVKLTMFLPDGTPVRATAACTFHDFAIADTDRRNELQSSDVAKTVVFQATDSLAAIAADEYNDPAQWRLIAKANGIANPRAVAPGTVLILPPLPS